MIIKPTASQWLRYKSKIKKIAIEPLQKSLINRLARAENHKFMYQQAIDDAFQDNEYLNQLDKNSQKVAINYNTYLQNWHLKEMQKQFKSLFALNISDVLSDSLTQNAMQPIIEANINLIQSIPTDLHTQVNEYFNQIIFTKGFDQKAIFSMLTQRFSVADSRSLLIARDQTTKTIGALDQTRQTQAGVKKFKWKTAEDDRVRPTHQVLDNQVFLWTAPPSIGIPGEPIQCRCVAIPYIDGISGGGSE